MIYLARERPPAGYDRNDFPLPHYFTYNFPLTAFTDFATQLIYMRTTKDSLQPETIEVNPRNTNYVVDTGSVICEESIVQQITIKKVYIMTEGAIETDKLSAIKVSSLKIMGVFKEAWNPIDELTSKEVEDVVETTYENTKMDVTPKFTGTALSSTLLYPVSTITMAEGFADINLTTDLTYEKVNFSQDDYFNSKKYYTNGGAVNVVAPVMENQILNRNRRHYTSYQNKFLPKKMRFGRRALFFGEIFQLLRYTDVNQVMETLAAPTNITHVEFKVIVSFNEWNREFNQKR